MAESGLSVGLPELRQEVGFFLGYGIAGWSAAQETEIDRIIQSGVRRVYYPPAASQETLGYEWSWLRPMTTLSLVADDYDYDLPDDFGRLIGPFHYPPATYVKSIPEVSIGKIISERANSNHTGDPWWVATRWKSSDGSGGQRREAIFYPTPDASRVLTYQYEAYQGALTEANPYPLGGMKLAELYIESCLAVAESRLDDSAGQHRAEFEALLVDAVARDRKNGAQYYGDVGNHEPVDGEFRRGWGSATYPITYHGDTI